MGGITARRTSGHDSKQIVFPPCASHTQQTPAAGAATVFGQFEIEEERFLLSCCERAMNTLDQTCEAFRQSVQYDQETVV
jgi:hypothetical protein